MNKRTKNPKQPGKQRAKRRSNQERAAARYLSPMLLQLVGKLPEGEHWEYEIKWDGYHGIAVIQGGTAQLWSRNERDLGKRFPAILEALRHFPAASAVIDGELVVLGADGKPSFQALQYFEPAAAFQLFFYVFDILHWNGVDLSEYDCKNTNIRIKRT